MVKENKQETVSRVEEYLSNCTIAVVTDYRGLPVSELSKLRRQLKDSGIEYHVVKNTLASIAAERTGNSALSDLLKGPSAIAFGHGDATDPPKILLDYIRISRSPLNIKGGLLKGRLLTSQEITAISLLPPREVLLAHLLQRLQTPISALVFVLSAQMRGLLQVLQARKEQLEGG